MGKFRKIDNVVYLSDRSETPATEMPNDALDAFLQHLRSGKEVASIQNATQALAISHQAATQMVAHFFQKITAHPGRDKPWWDWIDRGDFTSNRSLMIVYQYLGIQGPLAIFFIHLLQRRHHVNR